MSNAIDYKQDYANLDVLAMHLKRCDSFFVPRLSDKVEIEAYAMKIFSYAVRFEAWRKQELIGLVAAYCNDKEKRTSYITNVSVLPEWQGQGVAARLIDNCFVHLKFLGFEVLELEVDQRNQLAFSLYRKIGFKPAPKNKLSITMSIVL